MRIWASSHTKPLVRSRPGGGFTVPIGVHPRRHDGVTTWHCQHLHVPALTLAALAAAVDRDHHGCPAVLAEAFTAVDVATGGHARRVATDTAELTG